MSFDTGSAGFGLPSRPNGPEETFGVTIERCRDGLSILARRIADDFEFRHTGAINDGHCKAKSLVEHTRNFRKHVLTAVTRIETLNGTEMSTIEIREISEQLSSALHAELRNVARYPEQRVSAALAANGETCRIWLDNLREGTARSIGALRGAHTRCAKKAASLTEQAIDKTDQNHD